MTRVLHHNLLLPLQGRIRQQEGQVVEDPLGPEEEEEEEEEDSGLPSVPQAPEVEAGKRPASPQQKSTQSREASRQDASVDLLKESSTPRLLPESLLTIDSSDDEVYTDSLTSHTTASDSTIGNLTSPWVHFYPGWKALKQIVKLKVNSVPACPILKIVHL